MNPSWQLKSSDGVEYFEFSPTPRLLLAFFTRIGGTSCAEFESLNTSYQVGDKDDCVEENLERVRKALRLSAIITFRQTHSDATQSVDQAGFPSSALERDAFFTSRAGLGLGLRVADCLPVYLYAADLTCVGIAHCGWRGTAARLAEKTARQMSDNHSVPLKDMRFALGPCICPKCYEVGEDVRAEFRRSLANADRFFTTTGGDDGATKTRTVGQEPQRPRTRNEPRKDADGPFPSAFVPSWQSAPGSGPKYHLDIAAANRWLLTELGLTEVPSLSLCTFEDEKLFYSVRREKTTGRNLAVIALR